MQSHLNIERPESFQLKGSLLPMSVMELRTADIDSVKEELQAKVDSAPAFFKFSPIVFSFDLLDNHEGFKIEELIRFSRQLDLMPVGVKGANKGTESKARSLGLAKFSKGKERSAPDAEPPIHEQSTSESEPQEKPVNESQSTKKQPAEQSKEEQAPTPSTRVISTPVRSGQQIYSTGDLILLAAVSPGAEVLAGGNIHAYGPMRGRALAGVHGDDQARIFCKKQEAELLAISGHFLNDEKLKATHWGESTQIYFDGTDLVVDKLTI